MERITPRRATESEIFARIPPRPERKWVLSLHDHRGRFFNKYFYVDSANDAPGYFVYGTSGSGKTKSVGRPAIPKARGRHGNKVFRGWRRRADAEEVAAMLNVAADPTWDVEEEARSLKAWDLLSFSHRRF